MRKVTGKSEQTVGTRLPGVMSSVSLMLRCAHVHTADRQRSSSAQPDGYFVTSERVEPRRAPAPDKQTKKREISLASERGEVLTL
ncbi:uncharacterized [Tachysurus ichikawai]